MAKNNRITIYDLQHASGATSSPFVWATEYALKHKGFDLDVVGGLGRIPGITPLFGHQPREGDHEPFVRNPVVFSITSRNIGVALTESETARLARTN